jgi:choline dehydrogenase-like flavoprotein
MFYKESLLRRARALQAAVGDISPRKLYHQVRYGWDQGISVILMQGDSRGELSLVDSDPATKPVMKYNYLSSSADRQRLRDGMRLAAGLVDDPAYAELGASVIFPGKLADASDEALDSYIAEHVGTSIHMASTCRMDSARERGVVDQFCRVHGVDGLRVVDTSIMPSVVSRCPAASAIMLGERASAFFA